MKEAVNHPSHYGGEDDPFETIKVIEARGWGFHLSTAYRYLDRAGKKDPAKEVEDLQKAIWYIKRRIGILERRAPYSIPEHVGFPQHITSLSRFPAEG